MTESEKIIRIKEWIADSREQIAEEKKELTSLNYLEKDSFFKLLVYRESIIDQLSKILEDDI